jgi:hypothetical protein
VLGGDELTVLTSWAEAAAEALVCAPERVEATLAAAEARSPWRVALELAEPSPTLGEAIESMARAVRTALAASSQPPPHAVLADIRDGKPCVPGLDRLIRRILRSALEQRLARGAWGPDGAAGPTSAPT